MKRYDETYREFVAKLNRAYEQSRHGQAKGTGSLDRMIIEHPKLIENMPYEEVRKIGAKVRSDVADIGYLTKAEKELLEQIKKGEKNRYRQVAYRLTGNVDIARIMQRYRRFTESEEVFRTVYLYRGLQEPVRVVCERGESAFPVHDIRNLSRESGLFLIKNVLAAGMRQIFDIEKDPVLRMQGYLTGDRELLVILSIYPYAAYSTGIRGMLYRIFGDMDLKSSDVPVINEKTAREMKEQLRAKSIAYWKELMSPPGRSMTIPGERRKTDGSGRRIRERAAVHRDLDEDLVRNLTAFCGQNHASVKAVFLFAWGNLLGKYHNEKNPLMLVAQSGEAMNLFPVRFKRDHTVSENLQMADRQLKQSLCYSNCTVRDIEAAVGLSFREYFRMAHGFLEFCELDDMEAGKDRMAAVSGVGAEDTEINLFISYHLYGGSIGINYIAKADSNEWILDHLHELFTAELSYILSEDKPKFDKESFIQAEDTDEEKLYKIQIAQTALYLKESGIFESLTADEIMRLAECCSLTTYLSNDVVADEGGRISGLYIIGEGNVEESITAADGIVRTLRVIKKGSVFGVESLFAQGESRAAYTVASPQARIVEIGREVLTEEFRRRPDGWLALLEQENEQKARLQRLWTMD